LLGRLKYTIPNLRIHIYQKAKFWEVGVGGLRIQHAGELFEFAGEQVLFEG
jgi:hypothetical protein